ncbi:MAG: hypothetical protein IPL73_14975 [Candidatus Obscuribacter sp.]|nr:hypothetical protein [Candidatus Obscuribacter sp.]
MLRNEKQYKSARLALQKWLTNREILKQRAAAGEQPAWLVEEETFAIEQTIKQIQTDVEEYEETVSGEKRTTSQRWHLPSNFRPFYPLAASS